LAIVNTTGRFYDFHASLEEILLNTRCRSSSRFFRALKMFFTGGLIITSLIVLGVIPFTSLKEGRLSDWEFFSLLDNSRNGPQDVIDAASRFDYDTAALLWRDYLRGRDWNHFKPVVNNSESTQAGDDVLKHRFTVIGKTYVLNGSNVERYGRIWSDINWHDNPDSDNEWIWQLNRFSFTDSLAKAYLATEGNETYAWEFVCCIMDWIQDELPGNPWSWRTLDTSIRVNRWIRALVPMLNSSYFTPRVVLEICKSLVTQARFLITHHRRTNNWCVTESRGLLILRAFLPEITESTRWESVAWTTLNDFLQYSVYEDGGATESSSIGYHSVSLSSLLDAMEVSRFYNLTPSDDLIETRVPAMARFLLHAHAPDMKTVNFGDGNPSRKLYSILKAASYFPEYEYHDELVYFNSAGEPSGNGLITQRHIGFPDSGYYITRSGWTSNALFTMFDAGPYGTGHQHQDCLSFVMHAYGSTLLYDTGRYSYEGIPLSNFQRSSWGHNLFIIDGNGLNKVRVKSSSWCAGTLGTWALGVHNYWGADAGRELIYSSRGYWTVFDFWSGSGTHTVELLYQLPETQLVELTSGVFITNTSGANLILNAKSPWSTFKNVTNGNDGSNFGIYSYGYGTSLAGTTLILKGILNSTAAWPTVLYPIPANETNSSIVEVVPLSLEVNGVNTTYSSSFDVPGVAFAVQTPLGTDIHIILRERGTAIAYYPGLGSIRFTGSQCMLQLSNSTPGVVDGILSGNLEELKIRNEVLAKKASSVLDVRVLNFTIAAPPGIIVKNDMNTLTGVEYYENAYSYGGAT